MLLIFFFTVLHEKYLRLLFALTETEEWMPLVSGADTITQLLSSMESFPDATSIFISSIGFFLNTTFSPVYSPLISNEKCLKAVFTAMNFHPDLYRLQLWGTRLIFWYGGIEQTKLLAHSERVVDLISSNLKAFPTSVELLNFSTSVLMNISSIVACQPFVSSPQFVDLIFTTLSTGPANAKMRQNLIGLLFNLSNTVEHINLVIIPELPPLLALLIDAHKNVVSFALFASGLIANVSSSNKGRQLLDNLESVAMMNVLGAIHSSHAIINRNICGFYLNISSKLVFNSECIATIERTIALLPSDDVLRRWIFQYLYTFSFEPNFEPMATETIGTFLQKGLSSKVPDTRFYVIGCGITLNLSSLPNTVAVVANAPMITTISKLSEEFTELRRLQSHAAGYLSNILRSVHRQLLWAVETPVLILDSISRILFVPEPLRWAINALFELSVPQETRGFLATQTVVDRIIDLLIVIRAHVDHLEESQQTIPSQFAEITDLLAGTILNISSLPANRPLVHQPSAIQIVCSFLSLFYKKKQVTVLMILTLSITFFFLSIFFFLKKKVLQIVSNRNEFF